MRTAIIAGVCLTASIAFAAGALPSGWHMDGETAIHDDSGVKCPPEIAEFERLAIDPGADPNTLGVCRYAAGTQRAEIRVRRYARGEGESAGSIKNDQMLMEPRTAEERAAVQAMRMAVGEDAEGERFSRFITTRKADDLLIDCELQQPIDDEGVSPMLMDLLKACSGEE